jgi:hypothetical protein
MHPPTTFPVTLKLPQFTAEGVAPQGSMTSVCTLKAPRALSTSTPR